MARKKKTPADKAEAKRLKKSDAESDSIFDNDPILGDVFDDIQAMEDRKFSQYPEQRTVITGAQFIDLLFQHTEEEAELAKIGKSKIYKRNHEPFPEKIARLKFFVRSCIANWVKSGDLLILQGDVDRDFDSCEFPPKGLFRCIGEKRILDTMRGINLVVDERLESRIQESSKPEPSQPEPGPKEKASVTKNQGGRPKNDPDGLVANKIRELKNKGILQHHMCNMPEVIRQLVGKCSCTIEKLKRMSDDEYIENIGKPRSTIITISRSVFKEK